MSLFCWTQRKIFWRMWETEQFWGTIDFHSILFSTMEVNCSPKQPRYKLSSEYLPLCSAEQRNSYRFGTTWGWVNDDRIFGWTVPLNVKKSDIIFYNRSQNSVRSRFQSLHRQTPSTVILSRFCRFVHHNEHFFLYIVFKKVVHKNHTNEFVHT